MEAATVTAAGKTPAPPPWRANLATIAAMIARAKNELVRVPGAAIPGVLAPTIFFLGLNGVFGSLIHLNGFDTDSYVSFIVEGVREPIISGIDAAVTLEAVAAIAGIVVLGLVLSARALRHRLRVG